MAARTRIWRLERSVSPRLCCRHRDALYRRTYSREISIMQQGAYQASTEETGDYVVTRGMGQ